MSSDTSKSKEIDLNDFMKGLSKTEPTDKSFLNSKQKDQSSDFFGLLNKQQPNEFLKERSFEDLTKNYDSETLEGFVKLMKNNENITGQKFTLEKFLNNGIVGTQRSIDNDKAIERLLDVIKQEKVYPNIENTSSVPVVHNPNIQFKEIDLGIDLSKKLDYNKRMEGKFALTHVGFDTEAGEDSETNLNTAINWEAKRIVINWKIPKTEEPHHQFYKDKKYPDWLIVFIYSYDLWDALFFADYEVVTSTVGISSLQQGSSELCAIYKEIKSVPIPLNAKLMKENLYDERRSLWIPYHAGYDINKLNSVHKIGRGKREESYALNKFKTKFIKIRTTEELYTFDNSKMITNTTSEDYKIRLGNMKPAIRFNATCDTRFHFAGIPNITLAPKQSKAFSRVFACDLMILANSGQLFGGLEAVSKGTPYEKMKLEEEKIFFRKDLEIHPETNKISDKLRYNILDVLSTLSGYAKMTYYFPREKLEALFNFKYEKKIKPQVSDIYSTGSHAKQFLENYYASKCKIKTKELLANIQKQREYFENFKLTFMGGTTDSEIAKKLSSDPITPEELIEAYSTLPDYTEPALNKHILAYMDYRSQYPHASWLSNAERKIELACLNQLHNYLNSNVEEITNDFWNFVLHRIKYPLKPLDTNFFNVLDGNATIELKEISLQLRREYNDRKTEVMVPSKSKVTTHLADLAESCISWALLNKNIKHITPEKKVRALKKRVLFLKAERLDLGEPKKRILQDGDSPDEQDLFMKMFFLRIEIEEKHGKHDPLAQFLKYVLNSIYGVTAESGDGTYLGKFLIWCVSNSITALSRFAIKLDKTTYKYLSLIENDPEVIVCYNDTDSDITKATIRQHEIVRNIFVNTIPLEYEKDVSFKTIYNKQLNENINLQLITDSYFLGKKKYGLKHLKEYFAGITPDLLPKLLDTYVKIHGVGKKATTKTKPLYKDIYNLLMDEKTPNEIINEIYPKWEFWRQVNYKKKGGLIQGLLNHITNPIFTCISCKEICKKDYTTNLSVCCQKKIKEKYPKDSKSKLIEEFKYKDLPINLFKIPAKTTLICSDCKEITEKDKYSKNSICCFKEIKTKYQKESYLFTNVKRLTKGTFGDYYKFKNVIIAIFAPVADYRDLVFTILTESKKIPLVIKPLKANSTQQKLLAFLDVFTNNQAFTNPNYLLRSLRTSEDSMSRDMRFTLKLITTYFNKENKKPLELEYYRELLKKFNTHHIHSYTDLATFLNNKIESEFQQKNLLEMMDNPTLETNQRLNRRKNQRITLIDIIKQKDNTKQNISEYLAFLLNNKDIQKKIKQIITFNKSRFNLDYTIDESKSYIQMRPIHLTEPINDPEIEVRADFNQKINVDGIVYKGNATIARQDWKTSLQANQTFFFTQAVLNIGHLMSRQYLEKKHPNKVVLKQKLDELISRPPSEMPIALDNTQIVIPYKMRRYFDKEDLTEPINRIELLMSLDDSQIKHFCKKDRNNLSVLTFNKESDSYTVNSPILFLKLQEKIKRKAFYCGVWLNRKFAWELVSKSSNPMMINCTLRLNILVGQGDQENFNLQANLFLNPTSRGMFNLDLLNTTVNEVNDNSYIVKKLITHLYDIYSKKTIKFYHEDKKGEKSFNYNKEIVLRFFSRKASTTPEDLENNPKYLLDIQHLLICWKNLEKSIENMRYSTETLAITENIPTRLNKQDLQLLQNLFYQIAEGTLVDYQWETKKADTIAERIKELKINKHSESDGFSIRNRSNWSVMSFYIKNGRQFISKMTRVTKDNPQQTERGINKVLDLKQTNSIKENIFRIEITMFKYDKILQKRYYELLKNLVELFKEMEAHFVNLQLQEQLKVFTKFKKKFQPKFKKIVQQNLEIPERQELFTHIQKPPLQFG